jgi:hypothetical protein
VVGSMSWAGEDGQQLDNALPVLPGGRPCASHRTPAEAYHTRIGQARNPAPLARWGSHGSSWHPSPHVCGTCCRGHTLRCRVSSGLSSQESHGLDREEHPSPLLWQVTMLFLPTMTNSR